MQCARAATSRFDGIKWTIVVLLVVAAACGWQQLLTADESLLYRVLGIVGTGRQLAGLGRFDRPPKVPPSGAWSRGRAPRSARSSGRRGRKRCRPRMIVVAFVLAGGADSLGLDSVPGLACRRWPLG
jgi:hypothetical protein